MKRSHCQISSVCTQGLLKKCPTEFVRIATKNFLHGRHALALKFTIFMYLQKKSIYLSSAVLENPCWNLSCKTKIHQFSSKEQKEAKSLQNRNKHTNFIQVWFRARFFLHWTTSPSPLHSLTNCTPAAQLKELALFLSCWNVFHKEAHPRAPWFLASWGLQSAATSRVADVAGKSLEGITRGSLVSVTQLKAHSTLPMPFLRYLSPVVFKVSNFLALQFKAITILPSSPRTRVTGYSFSFLERIQICKTHQELSSFEPYSCKGFLSLRMWLLNVLLHYSQHLVTWMLWNKLGISRQDIQHWHCVTAEAMLKPLVPHFLPWADTIFHTSHCGLYYCFCILVWGFFLAQQKFFYSICKLL